MLQHQKQLARCPAGPAQRFNRFNNRDTRPIGQAVSRTARGLLVTAPKLVAKVPKLDKLLNEKQLELKMENSSCDSSESSESSDGPMEGNIAVGNSSTESPSPRRSTIRWDSNQELILMAHQLNCSELEMGNNCYDANNSGQGIDMQNLPSVAEQLEQQRTWMTIYFRYRVNWYEARGALSKMSREEAYRGNNLALWTRCLKVQLHRKTIFLHAIRAFRNRMRCAMSGVRFNMYAFYQDKKQTENRLGPEPKPLPYFRCPDDMPELKTMVVAQLNVFVSNSNSYFDQFWDESLNENA